MKRVSPKLPKLNGVAKIKPLRLLVVDDHAVVRHGVRGILEKGFNGASFGEANNASEMLEQLSRQAWEGVIMDVSMPGRHGLDALADVKRDFPSVPVLVLSMHDEDQYAIRALKAGASGYVTKDKAPEELVLAVTTMLSGRKYVSASLAEKLATDLRAPKTPQPHEQLSERELQVLCAIAKAKTIKEIATELSLSVSTVSTYHVRLLEKMGMTRDGELVRYALAHRLIE